MLPDSTEVGEVESAAVTDQGMNLLITKGEANSHFGCLSEVIPTSGESIPGRLFLNDLENSGRQSLCILICPEARTALSS